MSTGRVKWYNETRGFGFIETEDGKEVFVHRSGLTDRYGILREGQKVVFEIKQGQKGKVAYNVD